MLRRDWDDLDSGSKGDWAFMDTDHGLMIIIRWGDDPWNDCCFLYLDPAKAPPKYPVWDWNGDREAPTLSPSILVKGLRDQPDRWHGWMREGKLVTA